MEPGDERAHAELRRLNAETEKLQVEAEKLDAEARRLQQSMVTDVVKLALAVAAGVIAMVKFAESLGWL